MRGSVAPAALCATLALGACRATDPPRPTESLPPLSTTSGTIAIDGLSQPVRVTRDAWGIPHIYARTRDDLFVAQGFVQAQDRLFQMDLWRRAAQGRLSEVLGPNFIERDAMTRRVQYRGDAAAEWASYGSDAEAIAAAFVRGVNACVALARARQPEMFALAGWTPDLWSPADLLNRTDAFVAGGDAIAEVGRRGLSDVVADAIRRIGAPPFFVGLSAPVRLQADLLQADRELVAAGAYSPSSLSDVAVRDGVLEVAESPRRYEHPSARYLVHLNAPGWNVAGATAPWRPGVAVGHNDRIAWGIAPVDADTQDISEQPADQAATRVLEDSIAVKGRAEPFEYDIELTPTGVVVASDRARGRKYTLQWIGFQPGTAPEMAALAIDTAQTVEEFRAAAARWKMPAARLVAVTADGAVVSQQAAVVSQQAAVVSQQAAVVSQQAAVASRQSSGASRQSSGASRQSSGASRQSSVASQQSSVASQQPSVVSRALFAHVLAIGPAARERFNVGPLARPDRDQPFHGVWVPREWDASRVVNAPGQSESPDSSHFSDLADVWSAGRMIPFLFSDDEVNANAQATLMLVPRR